MLKLCTVLIGVQSALVRRDDHRSELQQQEEKKAAPVVQPASTPDGNLAAPVVQPASSMIESSSDADAEISPTKALTLLLGAVHTSQILYYLHLYQMSDGRPHLDDNGYNDYNGHNFIHYPNDNDLPGPESSK